MIVDKIAKIERRLNKTSQRMFIATKRWQRLRKKKTNFKDTVANLAIMSMTKPFIFTNGFSPADAPYSTIAASQMPPVQKQTNAAPHSSP